MRDDFCAFILTHGRPDRVHTYKEIRASGYTGRIVVLIDNEDKTAAEYIARYGDEVVIFDKAAVAQTFDEADNFGDRRAIVYARNVCFTIAAEMGIRYFVELDDDYTSFFHRFDAKLRYGGWRMVKTLDAVLEELVEFLETTPLMAVALSQGGDHIGGQSNRPSLRRKAMNSFVCSTERPFQFQGRVNEDVNTYTTLSIRGALFGTVVQVQLNQLATQSNAGGMTDMYLDSGTYIKSFYSVMHAPSCVKVGELGDPRSPHRRIHHVINWHNAAPKILRETHRKGGRS